MRVLRSRASLGRAAPSLAIVLASFFGCTTPQRRQPLPIDSGPVLGEIKITTNDIYDLEERPGFLYRAANALNVVIREEVIRREAEAVLTPGEPFDPELLEELERNLRALPFIGGASVTPLASEEGVVDVDVRTRDRFTLEVGAGLGFFGGSSKSRISLAETDFFGFGKRVQVTYKTDPDKDTMEAKYTDLQFLGSDHVLDLKLAETTDGHDHVLEIGKPFKTLSTRWSYGLTLGSSEAAERFFRNGDEVAKIGLERGEAGGFVSRAFGPRDRLLRLGGRLDFRDDVYGDPEGDQPGLIEVPEDSRVTTVGPTLELDWIPRYEEWQQVDAIDFVEDIPIGLRLNAFAGAQHRDPRRGDAFTEAALSAGATASTSFDRSHLLALAGDLESRHHGGPVAWRASSLIHYYFLGLPWQTWVFSAAADVSWETEDLNNELSLGEDNGLRGYPSRQFSGNKMLRFNVEDRIFPGIEILSVHIGAVAFFDAGMAWDRGEAIAFSDLASSVGLGLRFGSSELFGDKVLRVDFGYPLQHVDGEHPSISVSATTGQVVNLFQNTKLIEDSTTFGF